MRKLKRALKNKLKISFAILAGLFFIWLLIGVVILIDVKYTNWKRLSEIEEVDENSYRTFSRFIDDIESETGWHVLIISGLRSREKPVSYTHPEPTRRT